MHDVSYSDILPLKALWHEVFGDTQKYIDLYFRERFSPEKTYVYRVNGEITSALYYSDVCLKNADEEYNTAYICGISTKEAMRGRGQASELISECISDLKQKGYDAAFLIPASLSLFDFYKKFGFEVFSYLNHSEYDISSEVPKCTSDTSVPLKVYEKIPGLKVKRTAQDFLVLNECYKNPYIFSDGYIYSYKKNGVLFVLEHTYDDEYKLIQKINTIADKTIKKAKVLTPSVFNFGEKKPFSAFINLKNIDFSGEKYINLLLN